MITCTFEEGGNASLRHVVLTTIVNRNNQILLGKRGTYNGKPISEYGKWGPPGGFLERDETIAQAAARFDLVDLPSHEEFAFDHYENIKLYLEYLKKPFPLPCTSIKFSA